MKKLMKLTALLLTAVMVLSLVACGGNETADGDKVLKLFANVGSSDGLSVIDEEVLTKFKEKTGIDVVYEVVPSSGYQEKVQLMLASGEYPDVVLFPSTTTQAYIDSVESGIVVELNEYLTEENAPNLMKYTYQSAWEGVKFFGDDRIMAIPRTSLIRNEGIALRADWLDRIGMSDVLNREYHEVSADEFMEICKRMTFNDPDGNGKNDTFATSCWADDASKQYGPIEFSRGFYGDYGWYAYEGDTYKYMMPQYSKDTDIFKNRLQYTQNMFKDGYMDPDGPSLTKKNVEDKFKTGVYGIGPLFSGSLDSMEDTFMKLYDGRCATRENYVDYIYAADENGKVAGNGYYKPMWGQWCVLTTCEDPNMFVKYCDFLLSDEIWPIISDGREGLTYNIVDGGRVPVTVNPGERKLGCTFGTGTVRKAGDVAYFTGNESLKKELLHIKPYLENAFRISQETLVEQLDNGFVPSVSKNTEFINYGTTMAEKITKICVGELPVSEYDAVLDHWYNAGGKQYVEEMNDYIAKNQANK